MAHIEAPYLRGILTSYRDLTQETEFNGRYIMEEKEKAADVNPLHEHCLLIITLLDTCFRM